MSLDYSLCNQTVTLYGLRGDQVIRQVVDNAHYTWQVHQVTDEMGTRQETKFCLIVPGSVNLLPGDRIYDGIGPQIDPAQWSLFIPVLVPGLSQAAYVCPYRFRGEICHTEAGRR